MRLSNEKQKLFHVPPMEHSLKEGMKNNLSQVSQNSAWGFAIADFLEHLHSKSADDYSELLCEIMEDIQDGPGTMKTVLGRSYWFFRKMM